MQPHPRCKREERSAVLMRPSVVAIGHQRAHISADERYTQVDIACERQKPPASRTCLRAGYETGCVRAVYLIPSTG
jgi:hypothetical protein